MWGNLKKSKSWGEKKKERNLLSTRRHDTTETLYHIWEIAYKIEEPRGSQGNLITKYGDLGADYCGLRN